MLLIAVSRRCFSTRCCCNNLRTKRNSIAAMTSTERADTAIRNLVCSRQSASAAATVVLATIAIGKFFNAWVEAIRSWPSIGLVERIVPWLDCDKTFR